MRTPRLGFSGLPALDLDDGVYEQNPPPTICEASGFLLVYLSKMPRLAREIEDRL
jgi:hypothetical protein